MRISPISLLPLLASPALGQHLHNTSGNPVAAEEYQGISIALEGDLLYSSNGQFNIGPGRIDVFQVSTGEFLHSINDPAPQVNGRFGEGIDVDGNILTTSAPPKRELFIYDLDSGGAPAVADISAWANSGFITKIRGDRVYTTAYSATTPIGWGIGCVLVFDLNGNHVDTIYEQTGALNDAFGYSMDLDGDCMTISRYGARGATVYNIATGTFTELVPPAHLVPDDRFGQRAAMGGGLSFISANGYNGNTGAVFVYDTATGAFLYQIERPAGVSGFAYGWFTMFVNGKIYIPHNSQIYVHDPATGALLHQMPITGGATRFAVTDHTFAAANPFTSLGGVTNSGRVDIYGHGSIGTPFCTAVPNSTGVTGKCHVSGSQVAADNATTLAVTDIPAGEFALLVNGPATAFIQNPGGSVGNLCVAGGVGRFMGDFQTSSPSGTVFFPINTQAMPRPNGQPAVVAIQAGETWHFQGWHRDGVDSNFTEATSVTFQ